MITLQEAKEFIGIDHDLDDALITACIDAADEFILGAVGGDCPKNVIHSHRADIIRRLLVRDMYDDRRLIGDEAAMRGTVRSMLLQLRMEAMRS